MQPNTEPTSADVASVQAVLDGGSQPTPAAQPAAPQPGQVVQPAPSQPAPSSQPAGDPFESLFAPAPPAPPAPTATPTEPTAPPAPAPTEPTPTPQPISAPTEPSQSAPPAAPAAPETYQSYEDYMKGVLGDLDKAPVLPDHSKIAPDDEAGIKTFFDELVNTAVARAEQSVNRKAAIQASERNLWDEAMDKYGSLRKNKDLRDMVHNIRMGYFQKGVGITPTQAADKLLDAMKSNYQRGVADNTVITTIESTQPQGGGSGQPVPTTLDKQNVLTAVQDGGETALAAHLDAEIRAGRL